MKLRTAFLSTLGLSVLLVSGSAFAQTTKSASPKKMTNDAGKKAELGEAAPNFTLTDTTGKSHKLSDFKGKIVVMEWINPDCPVCRRVMNSGVVNAMLKDVKQIDPTVVFLAVNSTNYMGADASAAYMKKHKLDVPALVDQDGTVGKMYNARTTPHMFVIDAEGVLRYQGAIDDDPRGSKGDSRMNYVVNAIRQIKAGETVAPDYMKSYGCSVKYARN